MCVSTKLISCLLILFALKCACANECSMRCSRLLDPVCGLVVTDAEWDVRQYANPCQFHKILCLLKKTNSVTAQQVADRLCRLDHIGIDDLLNSRRYVDNTIVGSRNMCNHTCPTHCTDIYDPVCAEIWDPAVNRRNHVLINHCHADMLSCALQQTVQIQTLDHCLGSQSQFAYSALAQAAVLKRLGVMD